MKRVTLSILFKTVVFLLFNFSVSAQSKVNVEVKFIDSLNKTPISTAEISITHLNDTNVIKGYADFSGIYRVGLNSGAKYTLKVNAFGYKPVDIPIKIVNTKIPSLKLDNILMSKDSKILNQVI